MELFVFDKALRNLCNLEYTMVEEEEEDEEATT